MPIFDSFGICCLFSTSTCGDTITNNATYIRNPGFPASLNDFADCSYTIQKCNSGKLGCKSLYSEGINWLSLSDICWIRLDFESFTILGPLDTIETLPTPGGTCSQDSLTVTSTSGTPVPVICGLNGGQHSK